MKRLLVTGGQGFVGSTLAGMLRTDPVGEHWELADPSAEFDIRDGAAVRSMVRETRPEAVLHLAAQSFVPEAFRDPEGTLVVNVLGTLHLLQALREEGFRGRMVFVSSGDVYGLVPESALPISETHLPAPRNPYAVSKLAAEALCCQWSATEELQIVVARSFNHIGPGQSERFVVSDFARQIALIRGGRGAPMLVTGDLDVSRDFTDVRDVIRAYLLLLERGTSGEVYNVCSGRETSIRSMVAQLIELSGMKIDVMQDAERLRRSEQRRVVGTFDKLHNATGWRPVVPLSESLAAMLEYWERRIDG